jgi:hypothetical protein
MLKAVSPDCLSCAESVGCLDPTRIGDVCETVPGQAKNGQTETAMCLETMRCVFNTKCANGGEQNRCICGDTDVIACSTGASAPTGTCVAVYKQDFGDDGKFMYNEFINQKFGAGRANGIVQCVVPQCPSCRVP